jgi:DNA primase
MSFVDYLETNCSSERVSGGSQLLVSDDCPFCGSTGGLYVGVKKEIGICFKCSAGFSGIKFVAENEGCSRKEAARILGGIDDRYHGLDDEEDLTEPERWFPPCTDLPEHAREYMTERGFSYEFCLSMGLMYADQNVQTKDDKMHYTSNRVIIPVYDRAGNCFSWQGRDITGRSKIKYLIQPGFKAAEHLYNIQMIEKGKPVIVVEGVMDAWGWIKAGFTNVVATWGKKISLQQLVTLCSLQPGTVYMAWDGDALFERGAFAENHGHLFDIKMIQMGDQDADELEKEKLHSLYESAAGYDWKEKILVGLSKN